MTFPNKLEGEHVFEYHDLALAAPGLLKVWAKETGQSPAAGAGRLPNALNLAANAYERSAAYGRLFTGFGWRVSADFSPQSEVRRTASVGVSRYSQHRIGTAYVGSGVAGGAARPASLKSIAAFWDKPGIFDGFAERRVQLRGVIPD